MTNVFTKELFISVISIGIQTGKAVKETTPSEPISRLTILHNQWKVGICILQAGLPRYQSHCGKNWTTLSSLSQWAMSHYRGLPRNTRPCSEESCRSISPEMEWKRRMDCIQSMRKRNCYIHIWMKAEQNENAWYLSDKKLLRAYTKSFTTSSEL